jgi:hypothetical protein
VKTIDFQTEANALCGSAWLMWLDSELKSIFNRFSIDVPFAPDAFPSQLNFDHPRMIFRTHFHLQLQEKRYIIRDQP